MQIFSFTLAGHLLKGMKNANTKAATAKLLSTIISYSREPNLSNLLGYLCALLPNISDENAYLRHSSSFFLFYFYLHFLFTFFFIFVSYLHLFIFYLSFSFTFFYFYLFTYFILFISANYFFIFLFTFMLNNK